MQAPTSLQVDRRVSSAAELARKEKLHDGPSGRRGHVSKRKFHTEFVYPETPSGFSGADVASSSDDRMGVANEVRYSTTFKRSLGDVVGQACGGRLKGPHRCMMDSGATFHMISRDDLTPSQIESIVVLSTPIDIETVNGTITTREILALTLPGLGAWSKSRLRLSVWGRYV